MPIRLTLLLLLLLVSPARAQEVNAPSADPLVVGVWAAPPFAIPGEGGDWDGLGVQILRAAARELGRPVVLREVPEDSAVALVAGGAVGAALPAVATAEAEAAVDFTHPYFTTALGVAQPRRMSLGNIIGALFSPRFGRIVLSLSVLLLVVGLLAWLFERKANEDQFGEGSRLKGIWDGFWWAGVTMSTIGYGDKTPVTVPGRILALLWMLVAMGITASLTAAITSVLALGPGRSDLSLPGDLRGRAVGAVEGSRAAAYLETERVRFTPYADVTDALDALDGGDLDALVHDAAALRFATTDRGALRVQTTDVHPLRYAVALPEGSALREPLNRALLREMSEPGWASVRSRFLPER